MGQCSTLPTEGRNAPSSKKADAALMKEDSASQRRKEKYSHRSSSGRYGPNNGQPADHRMAPQNGTPQTRNPESYVQSSMQPMEEDNREGIPQPPEIATRTRCYKLHLDSDIVAQPSAFLGPFADSPPPLTYSSSTDSSSDVSPTQVAIRTASIFRGITVAKDGTILSQNARATRSSRGAKNKRGEKSRQATKIDKAKDLVEETILTGKAPDSNEPANMMSLVIMGEYDDMKYLVRDGSKKLREASELPDESILGINRSRGGSTEKPMARLSPRKRVSPNYIAGQRSAALHASSKSRPSSYQGSIPPRLKGHPRDHPSTRKLDEKVRRRESAGYKADNSNNMHNMEGDWSNTLSFSRGFHSIWNCGGTGEDTRTSPTQVASPREAKSHQYGRARTPFTPVFEGRGDTSNFDQAREDRGTRMN